jgi:hypothetical protein
MSLEEKTVQLYAIVCPESGEIRYIGKANNTHKRLATHLYDSVRRNTPLYRWMRALAKKGLIPEIRVLEIVAAKDWQAREVALIAEYRKTHKLLNVADGGDQPYCPPDICAMNARGATKKRSATPEAKRIYELKRDVGRILKSGYVTEAAKDKLRLAAKKAPHLFGKWANI